MFTFNIPCTGAHRCQPNITLCNDSTVIHGWVHMRHSRHNIMPPLRILVTTAVSRISPCVMTTVIHDGVHIRHSQHNTMPRFDYCRPPSNTVVQLCRKVGIFTAALCWTKRALWNGSHHDLLTLRESRHFSQRYVSKMIFTFLPPSDLDL